MSHSIELQLKHFEVLLASVLQHKDIPAARIQQAMHYVLFPGGKRFRPKLVYSCGQILQVSPAICDLIAVAIELIHCYSLVHDDLPAMDNDDYRRGRLSCHRAFDEATAILVGDGMQALAVEVLLERMPQYLDAHTVIKLSVCLLQACGACGMVSGQSLDLTELQKPTIPETQLAAIHELKTGKLIQACVQMVLLASPSDQASHHALATFATHLGLVFQMQDDYNDKYTGDALLGKGRSSDSANAKTTFASLYDKQTLSQMIDTHYSQALACLSPLLGEQHLLIALIDDLRQNRQHANCDG